MLKKILFGVVILGVGSWVWFGPLGSYVRTAADEGKCFFQKQVPDEFEIKRLRSMVERLDKQKDKLISAQAREMTEIDRLQREIATDEAWIEKEKKEIKALNDELKLNRTVYVRSGFEYTRVQFANELERRFNIYTVRESTLHTKKESLKHHHTMMSTTKEQLDKLAAAQDDLRARADRLVSKLRKIETAETAARVNVDHNEVARAEELCVELEKKLQTREFEVQLRGQHGYTATAPAIPRVNPDLARQIDEHLSNGNSTVAADK